MYQCLFCTVICLFLLTQAVKLLCVEKGKKNKINLVFVAGGRVLSYLGQAYERERALTSMLK